MTWTSLTTVEQMANIGSEVIRTINWKSKNKNDSQMAFYRALDLLGQTVKDPKNRSRLKEICRTKEMFVDWYLGSPLYKSTSDDWHKYFMQFAYAARVNR